MDPEMDSSASGRLRRGASSPLWPLESIGVRPRQAFERSGLTLSKNMKGLAPFWTKAKYGKMSINCLVSRGSTCANSAQRSGGTVARGIQKVTFAG
jgi:hypothetical protein